METTQGTQADAAEAAFLTPPAVAKRYGVAAETVIAWIRGGDLDAINVADPGGRRPRYRVGREALAAFEAKRAAVPKSLKKNAGGRRRRSSSDSLLVRRYS